MTTRDLHAYRASEEFAVAIRQCLEEIARFRREVMKRWDKEHPHARALWRRGGLTLDSECVGFDCPEGTTPEGLSRAQDRRSLIPKRGRSGDQWREALARLNSAPKMEPVFRKFGVDPLVWPDNLNGIYKAGIDDTPDGVFVTWAVPNSELGEHLTGSPLSVYYAAIEHKEKAAAP